MTPPTSNLCAGRIVGIFGLHGECKLDSTRLGADALTSGCAVRVHLANNTEGELRVRTIRKQKNRPLISFEGYNDPRAVQSLVGATLMLNRADVVLGAGEYLDADLIGCLLTDSAGSELGLVHGVEHYPAQDMLVVGSARTLIPLVAQFVKAVDVAARRIEVDLPLGLLDGSEAEVC